MSPDSKVVFFNESKTPRFFLTAPLRNPFRGFEDFPRREVTKTNSGLPPIKSGVSSQPRQSVSSPSICFEPRRGRKHSTEREMFILILFCFHKRSILILRGILSFLNEYDYLCLWSILTPAISNGGVAKWIPRLPPEVKIRSSSLRFVDKFCAPQPLLKMGSILHLVWVGEISQVRTSLLLRWIL